ncbi:MAG: phosphoribosylamine--glycine ligase [Euryarchaeota archaeon]|nr:phosphoribosylamine--glycine ligase [Euryarchaeota archaeon]|tara:strand:+ start:1791 stop:3065 length:1275 start_codon:yes stop_codon:yes gene_type:complete
MAGMDVLIVGSGGREHAIAIGLSESESVSGLHCTPGNAGTSIVSINHDVLVSDIEGIVELAKELSVSLVVVGPEAPLVGGLADRLREAEIPCFGPNSEGAMLEGSKLHAKKIMDLLNVPTGKFSVARDLQSIERSLELFEPPWVIKRNILAGGKGVIVTSSRDEALDAMGEWIECDGLVLIEEHLEGEEASVLVMMDESGYVMLPASQDHKRVGEGDKGPNTGGMGAYAPAPVATTAVLARTREEIVEPMHHYLRNSSNPYRGCLYVGLMIDEDGSPSVVEFNVRLGDPEAQVTIPLFETDFGDALLATAEGRISDTTVLFSKMHASTVVLASEGYPGEVVSGKKILGWDAIIEEGEVRGFSHLAGAKIDDDNVLVSNGGRVLSTTGIAPSLREALEISYHIIEGIDLEGSHYRKDIGFRALSK